MFIDPGRCVKLTTIEKKVTEVEMGKTNNKGFLGLWSFTCLIFVTHV